MNVAIIPARGGSKRIQRKNVREFYGKPIITYSIEAAKQSRLFESIYVSTDDQEIMQVALDLGCYIHLRSTSYLCGDIAGTQEVAQDCLLHSTSGQYTRACCIYATAPMLTAADLKAGLRAARGVPYAYVHGLYYWGLVDAFIDEVPLTAGAEVPFPSERYIDINTEEDWDRATKMFRKEAA